MTDTFLKMEQFKSPDPVLTHKIVTQLKSQGIFDEFRKECMADVDTKPAYQNLRQRVEGSVAAFLKMNPWRPDMNKNQLRDNLRKHIQSGGFLDIGVDRIVDQVVNPKIYSVFLPKVEEVVHDCLGMNKNKPKFEPPLPPSLNSEPPKFQNKHNLAPRAALNVPRMPSVPFDELLKPTKSDETSDDKPVGGNSPTTEKPANKSFVMDEDEDAEDEEEDEESPPFEAHSESDRLILGVRTDSSDSTNSDNQVVTTVVDDNLEDRIDNNAEENDENESVVKEERVENKEEYKKGDGFISDDSIPKTPTINMESSDGTMIEFNSISEYKRYQNKFDEDSLDNVEEEVVFSQWGDETDFVVKEESNSQYEEHSEKVSQKRKVNVDHFDNKSSSSFDKGSSCDEGKSDSLSSFTPKKFKREDDNETINELIMNNDSNTDKSLDLSDVKHKMSNSEHRDKSKRSSSKEGRSHFHHHSHKERKDSSSHSRSSSKGKHAHKDNRESSHSSRHSSRDKHHSLPKDDKHDKKDVNKEREKIKGEHSLNKHHSRESKSKYNDKENDSEKKKIDKYESDKKGKSETDKEKKESRHRHEHRDKSRTHHDKEKKKHDNHEKSSEGKKDYDSSYKHINDRKDGSKTSKHHHSSSKHSHRSSSDKHRSDKDQKHNLSDKHKSHRKHSEKDNKHEPKKTQRDYCKSSSNDFEGRRSSDRDSNGPSGNNFTSSTSYKSITSRNNAETTVYSSDKITSNSDNTVSENVEPLHSSKCDLISESGIASPDPEITVDSWNEFETENLELKEGGSDSHELDDNSSDLNSGNENAIEVIDQTKKDIVTNEISNSFIGSKKKESIENYDNSSSDYDTFHDIKENVCEDYANDDQNIPTPASVHDTSSEKENIDIADSYKESENTAPEVLINSGDKVVKFKKPKIAANIFEVRKIMQERRHLKRMEKKRMKLLMKTNSKECSTPESSPEIEVEEEDVFLGFESVGSENKLEMYDCLISRLNSEISTISHFDENPNLITSLIDVNPELDEYIETVLKGKVHRKTRVRLPPICEEFYKYDNEQNAYILIKNLNSNLNSLNPVLKTQEVCNNNISNECNVQDQNTESKFDEIISYPRHDISEESNSSKSDSENQNYILQADIDSDDSKSPSSMMNNNTFDDKNRELDDKVNVEDHNLSQVSGDIASLGISSLNDVTLTPKINFSLTFNQTYDEILKEKGLGSENVTKEVESKPQNRGSTVVKITNSKTTEQVILKKVELGFLDKSHVPKISRSDSVVNGKLTNSTLQMKQLPFIRRISKSDNVVLAPSSSVKSQCFNGVASADSTSFEAEVALPDKISPKTINDMIGIGGNVGQRSTTERTWLRQRNCKDEKQEDLKTHQRYSSSDLYKPRLQITSRRGRGQSSPETVTPPSSKITRKRASVTHEVASNPKRRR